jgi:hypothetical protein
MASWSAIETALQNWVEMASGYDDAHVIFADQPGAIPDGDYITLRKGVSVGRGAFPWLKQELLQSPPDPDNPLRTTVVSRRNVTVSIQAYTKDVAGDESAWVILEGVRAALALPSIARSFRELGVTVLELSGPINLSALMDTDFEGRAALDVSVFYAHELSEDGTYIETARITDASDTPHTSFDVP